MSATKPTRVLANAKDLLDALAERGALSPAEIAEAIDVPRPTVYRLAAGLEAVDLVRPSNDGRINLSKRWLRLADASRAGMREWRDGRAALDRIAEDTGQTAFLSVPRGTHAVCIDWAPGRGLDVLILRPGRTLPLHAGAAGRAFLAFRSDDEVEHYLTNAPFEALTPTTLTTADELRADVARTRDTGHSTSDEDVTVGIGAIGVPVRDAEGTTVGCLSVGGLAEDIRSSVDELAEVLRREAALLPARVD